MFEYIQNNTWSVSILVGFFTFAFFAAKFCHFGINQAKDKSVAPLCLVISALCGLVLTVFVHVILTLAH